MKLELTGLGWTHSVTQPPSAALTYLTCAHSKMGLPITTPFSPQCSPLLFQASALLLGLGPTSSSPFCPRVSTTFIGSQSFVPILAAMISQNSQGHHDPCGPWILFLKEMVEEQVGDCTYMTRHYQRALLKGSCQPQKVKNDQFHGLKVNTEKEKSTWDLARAGFRSWLLHLLGR